MKRRVQQMAALLVAVALLGAPPAGQAEPGRRGTRKPARTAANSATDAAAAPVAPPDRAAQPEVPGDSAGPDPAADAALPDEERGPGIQTLGEEGMRAHFVDHAGPWSVHAENLPTDYLFRLWQEIGGPEVVSRMPVDRVYTISVHREPVERIVERILDGYGYTLHYDAGGRLEMVRVYSLAPTAAEFRTPRLVENLSNWRDVELEAAAPSAAATQSN